MNSDSETTESRDKCPISYLKQTLFVQLAERFPLKKDAPTSVIIDGLPVEHMHSTNYNECVVELLRESKKRRLSKLMLKPRAPLIRDGRRQRIKQQDFQLLWTEFEQNTNWSKNKIREIARKLNLSYSKVYKWNFD